MHELFINSSLDDGRESAFLIQDMFPITGEYIEREYTIAGNHLMLTSEHTVKEIEQKASLPHRTHLANRTKFSSITYKKTKTTVRMHHKRAKFHKKI